MDATLNRYQPQILSIFRIVFGLLILQHGCQKWFGFPIPWPGQPIQLMTMIGWAGVIELVGGALITVGLFTRFAALIVSGEMAVAFWTVHILRGWTPIGNGGNIVTAYCFATLLLVFYGGGPWSIDAMMRKKS